MNPGQHQFEFNRTTRRMVCSACGGKMNECPELCPGRRMEPETQVVEDDW